MYALGENLEEFLPASFRYFIKKKLLEGIIFPSIL